MTPNNVNLYEQALTYLGLSTDQSHVYELLLQKGGRQAGQIPRALGISRPHAYKILDELIELGLITKEMLPGKPAQFIPVHPFALQELARKRKEESEIASQMVQGIMGSLISDYTSSSRVPGIRIISGFEGLKELYDDILHTKKDISLLRSTRDDHRPELLELVLKQIQKQVSLGINARLISPLPADIQGEALRSRDSSRLTTRKIFSRESFSVPSQILLYGNKVGITAYEDQLMTTIIENEAIAITFQSIFEILWETAKNPFV